jgi:hypothetical protein
LIGVVVGDYPMDAFCQGHTQPEPVTYYYPFYDFGKLIAERDDARKWAREMYQRALKAESLPTIEVTYFDETGIELTDSYRLPGFEERERLKKENVELRRQLEIATEVLEWYAGKGSSLFPRTNCEVAIRALEKMDGISYKSARGILPWKEGDEPAEDAIRRTRGGGE